MLEIDLEKCIKCGECARTCPAFVIEVDKEVGAIEKHPEVCIICGHCVAVCPTDAIIHKKMDMNDFQPMKDPNISYDQLYQLIRNRRSIRRYKDKPVEDEDIDKLMKAVRYIPTAENDQHLKYLIIRDKDTIAQIRRNMASKMKFSHTLLKILFFVRPFLPKSLKSTLNLIVEKWESGGESGKEDPFLRTAPTVVIIYAKKKSTLRYWDAAIASYNMMLVARTLGVDTVWNGVHAIMANSFGSLRKDSKVPKGHKVVGTVCMGYPDIKFRKTINRKPLDITKID